ncbi:uncharacterized protein LOC127760232 [Oryza glaberrima]|uniref:uncharacterized protein LOC127760232 n=1 Tax=Oryza glaberrima TaxID=4538 RepID=UPI00224C62DA|nr:uncharacterized protein LOC127760232 [Oryza glaberrima]
MLPSRCCQRSGAAAGCGWSGGVEQRGRKLAAADCGDGRRDPLSGAVVAAITVGGEAAALLALVLLLVCTAISRRRAANGEVGKTAAAGTPRGLTPPSMASGELGELMSSTSKEIAHLDSMGKVDTPRRHGQRSREPRLTMKRREYYIYTVCSFVLLATKLSSKLGALVPMATMDASTRPVVIVAVAVVDLVVVVVSTLLWTVMAQLVWRPYAVGRALGQQGVRGPAYQFLVGNIGEANAMRAAASGDVLDRRCHDVVPRVLPHYHAWMLRYSKVFVSWTGPFPALCVGDYAMVKEILADRTGLYAKPDPGASILALFGNGLAFINGDDWARHRRIVHSVFAMDKLKMMTKTMAEYAHVRDPGVGGSCHGGCGRRRADGAGGGRRAVPRADRRRDLTHGVRRSFLSCRRHRALLPLRRA